GALRAASSARGRAGHGLAAWRSGPSPGEPVRGQGNGEAGDERDGRVRDDGERRDAERHEPVPASASERVRGRGELEAGEDEERAEHGGRDEGEDGGCVVAEKQTETEAGDPHERWRGGGPGAEPVVGGDPARTMAHGEAADRRGEQVPDPGGERE